MALTIQIPCSYENNILIIKGLKLTANGETAEKAFLECIKNTVYYTSMKTSKIVNFTDFKGRDFMHLEVPFTNTVYEAITEIEPFPSNEIKKKQLKSFLTEPSAEDTLKFGY